MAQFISEAEPQPVIMHVATDGGHPAEIPPGGVYIANTATELSYYVGLPSAADPTTRSASPQDMGCAGILVEYGAGPAVRTIVMDLKPGSYQLPPCTQVRTSLIAYRSDGAASFTPVNVSITLSGGQVIGTPTRPVVTTGRVVSVIGGAYQILSPAGARWWDLWAGLLNVEQLTAAAPDVIASEVSGGGLIAVGLAPLYRGYSSGIFMPCWGPVEFGAPPNTTVIVYENNASADDQYAWLRFFLEF